MLQPVRVALRPIEQAARSQAWAKQRPWTSATHVAVEQGVVVVDLHDLSAKLARKAVRAVVGLGPPPEGARVFVVGQGRHSLGRGVLGKVVRNELGRVVRDEAGWTVRMAGPGRVAWITDRRRAPKELTGGGGLGFGLFLLGLGLAFGFAVGRQLGLW